MKLGIFPKGVCMEAITKIKLISAAIVILLFLSSTYANDYYEEGQGYDSATAEDYEAAPNAPKPNSLPAMDYNSEGPDYSSEDASSEPQDDYSY
jgi:hypothetical protein